ncbi:hypothetical protein GUI12_01365 [Anaplasmataceae bacterium AB001_6]|nr:hypothetical protein GUI12_01365 [Anaplasmataceae bacterium AB001_6]
MLLSLERHLPNVSLLGKVEYCMKNGYDICFKEVRVDTHRGFGKACGMSFDNIFLQSVNYFTGHKEAFAVIPDSKCNVCNSTDNKVYKEIKHDHGFFAAMEGVPDYDMRYHSITCHPDLVHVEPFAPFKVYTYIPDASGEMTIVYL